MERAHEFWSVDEKHFLRILSFKCCWAAQRNAAMCCAKSLSVDGFSRFALSYTYARTTSTRITAAAAPPYDWTGDIAMERRCNFCNDPARLDSVELDLQLKVVSVYARSYEHWLCMIWMGLLLSYLREFVCVTTKEISFEFGK